MISRAGAFVQAARGPVLLILLGTLFALQQAGMLDFSRSWPLLIIAIGCMKLLERVVAGPVPQLPPAGVPGAAAYAPGGPYSQGYMPPGQRPAGPPQSGQRPAGSTGAPRL